MMMTQEEKYKEALERASKLRVQNPFDTVGQMVEHIFPELAESEDEKIRKRLIKTFGSMVNPKKGNAMLDQIRDEQNKRCCQNCKNFVPFNHDCIMRGYDMYRCIDYDFKDFEAK